MSSRSSMLTIIAGIEAHVAALRHMASLLPSEPEEPRYSREEILKLIDGINEAIGDGAKLAVGPGELTRSPVLHFGPTEGVPEFPDRSTYVPHDGKTNPHAADPGAIFEAEVRDFAKADQGREPNWIGGPVPDPKDIVGYRIVGRNDLPRNSIWHCNSRCKLRSECRRRPACEDAPV